MKARGGQVIAVTSEGERDLRGLAHHRLSVPETLPLVSPIVTTIPLQLLACHIAVLRGCDVDRPRNLAKSVTASEATGWDILTTSSPKVRPHGAWVLARLAGGRRRRHIGRCPCERRADASTRRHPPHA